jgi:orotate phosphoribosyltransferase
LIALDRQELGPNDISAIDQVERDYGIKVVSIVCLDDIVEYLQEIGGFEQELAKMTAYREEFGCKKK